MLVLKWKFFPKNRSLESWSARFLSVRPPKLGAKVSAHDANYVYPYSMHINSESRCEQWDHIALASKESQLPTTIYYPISTTFCTYYFLKNLTTLKDERRIRFGPR